MHVSCRKEGTRDCFVDLLPHQQVAQNPVDLAYNGFQKGTASFYVNARVVADAGQSTDFMPRA